MQVPPTHCPRCEALQPFRPQSRPIADNRIEVFIRCTVCRWESVLYESSPDIERLRRMERRWEAYGRALKAKHGVVSTLAQSQLRKIRRLLREHESRED